MSKAVVIGAGLAGLSAALALAPMPVVLVTPGKLGEGCSSGWAQGGIAAAVGADDSAYLHAEDTMAVGGGLNDAAVVRQAAADGPAVIERLVGYGVVFDRDEQKRLRLGLEAAHRRRRIVHARDATGRAVMEAMIAAVRAAPSVGIMEDTTALRLAADDGITGVTLRRGDEAIFYGTGAVVLASGGAAALWRDTTNPHGNWGSGLALAAKAGATLGDLEFMQFHPTAIDVGRDPMPLASEALRGEGAVLVDETGSRFTDELQPRDVVTRAIWAHRTQGHKVFLDALAALGAAFAVRFPTIYKICIEAGIDPATTPIPVRPAAHYHMGGVVTDARGRTDVAGLWACGEVACTGLHGANRLASNSLLEAAAFGKRVAEDVKGVGVRGSGFGEAKMQARQNPLSGMNRAIRAVMTEHVGVRRDAEGLTDALSFLSPLAARSDMALVAAMIATAALKREESRGAHHRADFPQTSAEALRSVTNLADLELPHAA